MGKYLLGVLSGIFVVFFLAVVVILIGIFAAGSGAPSVASDSVLQINLSGGLAELPGTELSLQALRQEQPVTVLSLRRAIARAAEDDRIQALVLRCGGLGVGWGKAQEIRWAIEEFKQSGKPVYAFMEVAGMRDYYVAAVADEIYLAPEGYLDLKGMRAEVSFYKDTMEKLGVEAEMVWVGKYKSAIEPYSRNNMSDAFREVVDGMLDEYMRQYVDDAAASRELSVEQFRAALDQGPLLPAVAQELGVVDGLLYPDEFEDLIAAALELDELNKISLTAYQAAEADGFDLTDRKQIAILYGVGSIMRGFEQPDPFSSAQILASETFSKTVKAVRENDEVEAVVLRINSPGGDAIASDRMWRELNLLQEEKPIVVSMSDVAASGGYYMAMVKDAPIVAYPGTVTGSIGVFYGKINLKGLYDKIGLKKEILTRGRYAAIDSDYVPLGVEGREKVQESVDSVYSTFVQKVADARGRPYDEMHEVAQGRVWIGARAVEAGLVDELGGFDRAIAIAKEKAGIDPDEEVALVTYPRERNWFEVLLESESGFSIRAADLAPKSLREAIGLGAAWPVLAEGGVLALSPLHVAIR